MVSSQAFLNKCQTLHEKGFRFETEQGSVIARGFADLGFEEFILLSSNKICSLYSGKTSDFPAEERHRFFAVPDCDALTSAIVKLGADINTITFIDNREWKLAGQREDRAFSIQSPLLRDLLINCLLDLI